MGIFNDLKRELGFERQEDPPELRASLEMLSKTFEGQETDLPSELQLPANLEIRKIVAQKRDDIRQVLGESASLLSRAERQKVRGRSAQAQRFENIFRPVTPDQERSEVRRYVLLPEYMSAEKLEQALNNRPTFKTALQTRLGEKMLKKEALQASPVLRYALFFLLRQNDPEQFLNNAFGGPIKDIRPAEREFGELQTKTDAFKNGETVINGTVKQMLDLTDELQNYPADQKKYADEIKNAQEEVKKTNEALDSASKTPGLGKEQMQAAVALAQQRWNDAKKTLEKAEQKLEELERHKKNFQKQARSIKNAIEEMLSVKMQDGDTSGLTEYQALIRLAEEALDETRFFSVITNSIQLKETWHKAHTEIKTDLQEREWKLKEKETDMEKAREAAKTKPTPQKLLYVLIKQGIKTGPNASTSEEALTRQAMLATRLAMAEARDEEYVREANEVRSKELMLRRGPGPSVWDTISYGWTRAKIWTTYQTLDQYLQKMKFVEIEGKTPFATLELRGDYTRNDFVKAVEKHTLDLPALQNLYLMIGELIRINEFKMRPEEMSRYYAFMREARNAYLFLREERMRQEWKKAPEDKRKEGLVKFFEEKLKEEEAEEARVASSVGEHGWIQYLQKDFIRKKENEIRQKEADKKKEIRDKIANEGFWKAVRAHGAGEVIGQAAVAALKGIFSKNKK